MYIVAVKLFNTPNAEIANASVEYAFRVLSKLTGKKLYSTQNSWVMKCPDKLGDMDAVRSYYKYEPKYIRDVNHIPNESQGVETYLKYGDKATVGYGMLYDVLQEHRVPYDIIEEKSL